MFIADLASGDVILIVVVVIALLFGTSRIPKIARGLGSAKTEFEKGLKEGDKTSAASTEEPKSTDKPAS